MTTKRFAKRHLIETLGLPHEPEEGVEIVSDRQIGSGRWSIHHELIFREPGMAPDEAWLVTYSTGATESQDERPWQYSSEVEATLVRHVEKLVKVWEPAS